MSNLSTLQRSLLALLIIVVIAIVAFFGYSFWHSQQGSTAGSFSKSQLFFGNALTGPLYGLDISTPNQKPQPFSTVPGVTGVPSFSSGSLMDVARSTGKTFYSILSKDKKSSDIYFTFNSDTKHALHEVTFSPGIKAQLSYNEPSNTLAFTSLQSTASSTLSATVSVINTSTNSEKDLGPGSNPVVLPGGAYVLIRDTQNRSISVVSVETGKETSLVSIDPASPFAVSPDGKNLAIYSSLSKQIMYFDISQILSASYSHSDPVPFTPIMMTYSGNKLLVGGISNNNFSITIQLINEKTPITQIANSIKIPYPEYIEFSYE